MSEEIIMLGLYVTFPWPLFYKKGMKTWEIRNYPIDYRGDILIIESGSNRVISKMTLADCIPLNKKRWEMNYEKHRTSCSYEALPYHTEKSPAYAWVLSDSMIPTSDIIIPRHSSKPYFELDDNLIKDYSFDSSQFIAERLACKFIDNSMLIYWLKKDYFALVAITNLTSQKTTIITEEISLQEIDFITNQLDCMF